jgi:hypothetical protein
MYKYLIQKRNKEEGKQWKESSAVRVMLPACTHAYHSPKPSSPKATPGTMQKEISWQ